MVSTLPGYKVMFFCNKWQFDIGNGFFRKNGTNLCCHVFIAHDHGKVLWKITVVEELLHIAMNIGQNCLDTFLEILEHAKKNKYNVAMVLRLTSQTSRK